MSLTRTRTGRPALACDGRQHPDGEHECARRFWSPTRHGGSYPNGVDSGDLRVRARRRGWATLETAGGVRLDLCPYHAPERARVDVCANRWPGSMGSTLKCEHPESCHRDGFCDVVIGDDILCGCPKFTPSENG